MSLSKPAGPTVLEIEEMALHYATESPRFHVENYHVRVSEKGYKGLIEEIRSKRGGGSFTHHGAVKMQLRTAVGEFDIVEDKTIVPGDWGFFDGDKLYAGDFGMLDMREQKRVMDKLEKAFEEVDQPPTPTFIEDLRKI